MTSENKDRRIEIQQKTLTQDSYGEPIETWQTLFPAWAEVKEIKGEERFARSQEKAEIDTVFVIRYRRNLSPLMRVLYEGREYNIQSLAEVGRRVDLEIHATARAE